MERLALCLVGRRVAVAFGVLQKTMMKAKIKSVATRAIDPKSGYI